MGKLSLTATIYVFEPEDTANKSVLTGGFAMLFSTTAKVFANYFSYLSEDVSEFENKARSSDQSSKDLAMKIAQPKLESKLLKLYKISGAKSKSGKSPNIFISPAKITIHNE